MYLELRKSQGLSFKQIMWIARDMNGKLFIFRKKPVKNVEAGIWEGTGCYEELEDALSYLFGTVRWSDEEPTQIILKRKEVKHVDSKR